MDYKKLSTEIKNIVELVEKIPEKYQEKTYDLLLNSLLNPTFTTDTEKSGTKDDISTLVISVEVKGLLKKHSLTEKSLEKIFFIEGNQAVPIYEIPTNAKSTAQIHLSLLSSLENSLNSKTGELTFSIEKIRELCKQRKCYDSKNFAGNFKSNKALFTNLEDEECVGLSKEGKDALAELIKTLA